MAAYRIKHKKQSKLFLAVLGMEMWVPNSLPAFGIGFPRLKFSLFDADDAVTAS